MATESGFGTRGSHGVLIFPPIGVPEVPLNVRLLPLDIGGGIINYETEHTVY